MAGSREVSFTRRRPIGSAIVAAGASTARDHFLAVADRFGILAEFIEIDDYGKLLKPTDEQIAAEAELLWCHGRFTGSWVMSALQSLPGLDWVHSDFVGVDALDLQVFFDRGIAITNGGHNFSLPMAEFAMLGMLASAKQFPFFVRKSDAATWDNSVELSELVGAKLLLLGLGSVNTLVAAMSKGFGLEVVAWSRTKRSILPEGVSRHVTGDAWLNELSQADYVVVGLPLTSQTRGLIDEKALEMMKDDVTIINLARGPLIDERALVETLDSGRLKYVLLDAYSIEPIPSDSPLWRRRNVTVLPHHSWSSPRVIERTVELLASQLQRWTSGSSLYDPVDFAAGY